MSHFEKLKTMLTDLGYPIVNEIPEEEIVLITDETKALLNMVLDCEEDLLIIEQIIAKVQTDEPAYFKQILQINRHMTHGAFVLDEAAETLIYRATLELPNLDPNELDASINALTLGLMENLDFFLGQTRELSQA